MTVTLIIPRCPPRSLNRLLRMHWARRQELMELWRQEVAVAAMRAGRPKFKAAKIRLRLYYDRHPLPDLDNALAAAAKLVLDGLVASGIIPDDDARHVRGLTLAELAVDRKNPRVEVEVSEA